MKPQRAERQEHLVADLQVTKAACTCGAKFVLSDTLASSLSQARCQDELLDMYHQHRDAARAADKKKET